MRKIVSMICFLFVAMTLSPVVHSEKPQEITSEQFSSESSSSNNWSVNPSNGTNMGGTNVTIIGSNFTSLAVDIEGMPLIGNNWKKDFFESQAWPGLEIREPFYATISVAVDDLGISHLAFLDAEQKLMYANNQYGSWNCVAVTDKYEVAVDVVQILLAESSTGTTWPEVHISYRNDSTGAVAIASANYPYYGWNNETSPASASHNDHYHVALDPSNDELNVVYLQQSSDSVIWARMNETSGYWHQTTVAQGNISMYGGVVMDIVHTTDYYGLEIGYAIKNGTSGLAHWDTHVEIASHDGLGWNYSIIDTNEKFKISSILSTNNGEKHVMYWADQASEIRHVFLDNNSLSNFVVDSGANGVSTSNGNLGNAMLQDGNGDLHFSYHVIAPYNSSNNSRDFDSLMLTTFDGSSWTKEVLDREYQIGQGSTLSILDENIYVASFSRPEGFSSSASGGYSGLLKYFEYSTILPKSEVGGLHTQMGEFRLDVDQQGIPYMLYSESNQTSQSPQYWQTNPFQLKIAKYVNSVWTNYTISGESSSHSDDAVIAQPCGLELDSSGNIHIAYMEWYKNGTNYYNSNRMNYAKSSDGISWDITENITNYGEDNGCDDIALSKDGSIHIIGHKSNSSNRFGGDYKIVVHSSDNGLDWTQSVVDDSGNLFCSRCHIESDNNNNLHVLYFDEVAKRYKYSNNITGVWLNNDWNYDPADTTSGDNSLFVDSQNRPHVSYISRNYSSGSVSNLIYAVLDGTEWKQEIISSISGSGHDFQWPSISVNLNDDVFLSYSNYSSGERVELASNMGGSWKNSVISVVKEAENGRVKLDTNGNLHMGYFHNTGSNGGNYVYHLLDNNHFSSVNLSNRLNVNLTIGFGDFTQIFGTVVDDSTISLVTPPGPYLGGSVNLTIWSWNGESIVLNGAFTYDSSDNDQDGIGNEEDDCPNIGGNSSIGSLGCPDTDGDGYSDYDDLFPTDPNEWTDLDGDGVGDNSDEFPYDKGEFEDSDGDGVGDNSDAFPFDENESMDTDFDGVGDNADDLPYDSSETVDTDGDGIGDNSDAYPEINNYLDSDGDSFPDIVDDFPTDMTQWRDSDGDGWGDNLYGVNPDQCPFVSGVENGVMPDGNLGAGCPAPVFDEDGDGVEDDNDECPNTESLLNVDENGCASNQKDGDEDGVNDSLDQCISTTPLAVVDSEGCLLDVDNDGVYDLNDRCLDTSPGSEIDENGCEITVESTKGDDEAFSSRLVDGGTESILTLIVITVLVLTISISQTNYGAKKLPKSLQWIQVIKRKDHKNKISKTPSVIETKINQHPDKNLNGEINPADNYEYLEFPSGEGAWYIRDVETQEWKKWE